MYYCVTNRAKILYELGIILDVIRDFRLWSFGTGPLALLSDEIHWNLFQSTRDPLLSFLLGYLTFCFVGSGSHLWEDRPENGSTVVIGGDRGLRLTLSFSLWFFMCAILNWILFGVVSLWLGDEGLERHISDCMVTNYVFQDVSSFPYVYG